jgi:phosphoglycerol transferase MdoB-like AlkP superfamily enzyme
VWTREQLTDEHVPLLFYAPRLLKPQQRTEVVSQIDVLPTVAALAGQRYTNTTLGRDLLSGKGPHYAFTIQHDKGRIGLLTDSFYFTRNLNFHQEEVHALAPDVTITDSAAAALRQRLSSLTTAYYETAKWMLLNNKKDAAAN